MLPQATSIWRRDSQPNASGRPGAVHPEDGAAPPLNRPLGAQLDDMEYFQARAEQELAWAQRASHAAVVAAHYELAERYLERVSRWGDEEPSQGH